jgi:hypothetical protein
MTGMCHHIRLKFEIFKNCNKEELEMKSFPVTYNLSQIRDVILTAKDKFIN